MGSRHQVQLDWCVSFTRVSCSAPLSAERPLDVGNICVATAAAISLNRTCTSALRREVFRGFFACPLHRAPSCLVLSQPTCVHPTGQLTHATLDQPLSTMYCATGGIYAHDVPGARARSTCLIGMTPPSLSFLNFIQSPSVTTSMRC